MKKFTDGLDKLIDGVNATKARVVLMTPMKFENVKPLADSVTRDKELAEYRKAMQAVATSRKLEFVDLFDRTLVLATTSVKPPVLTENGLHLKEDGYLATASLLVSDDVTSDTRGRWEEKLISEEAKPLRAAIVAKNELFFHRWRPQNLTYLTGFRKHEQGNNAKEIAQFDPLVEKAEKQIAELKAKVK